MSQKQYINYFESKKDNNIFHAVDKGIKKSKGEIIIWINSDDILHPSAAENVVKIFKGLFNKATITGRDICPCCGKLGGGYVESAGRGKRVL